MRTTSSKQDGDRPFEQRFEEHMKQVRKDEAKLLAARKAHQRRMQGYKK